MPETTVLSNAAAHAIAYLEQRDSRPVSTQASVPELRAKLRKPLPEEGLPPERVIDELVRDVEGGILGSTSGRFFGWVIGGTLPAALAADWLTSAWDQNAAAVACSPAEAVVEEVCGAWLKELLGLPETASFGFVTGCQMAHTTALAAARHRLLAERGWDVEARGLAGAPALGILTGEHRHESLLRSVRLLGIGSDAVDHLPCDQAGRVRLDALAQALERRAEMPAILCLQAGDLNVGSFDPFAECCALAKKFGAWVHVDGAFGLWAAASDRYRALLEGVEGANSWATDGHKWLNLPFDSGFVFVSDSAAHRAVFSEAASYEIAVDDARAKGLESGMVAARPGVCRLCGDPLAR